MACPISGNGEAAKSFSDASLAASVLTASRPLACRGNAVEESDGVEFLLATVRQIKAEKQT